MPHNPLTGLLKNVFATLVKEDAALTALMKKRQESRRKFLRQTAIAAAGMAFVPSFLRAANFDNKKNIVIIGGGMAGLNAAYQLKKRGLSSTVYEASNRIGGRMFTMKNYFGKNITTDIGGEFVDTTHTDILQLLQEFDLDHYDLRTETIDHKTFYFEGKNYTKDDLAKAIQPYAPQIAKDMVALPGEINYKNAASFEQLDKQSITEYITALGIAGWLYNFLNVLLTREFGMEASEQSAINLLIMFDAPAVSEKEYEIFGDAHEVFKIKGGSQHLTDKLYQHIKNNVVLKHPLIAIKQHATDGYELSFKNNEKAITVKAGYIILALPFTILRKLKLDIDMPAEKRKCIDELGYGNSCKFIMGFSDKPWRKKNKQGYTFTDEYFGCGWDSSQLQSSAQGSFTVFGGGKFGDELFETKQQQSVQSFIPSLDKIYPGSATAYRNKNIKFCWAKQPFTKAGYSAFKKGQYSTLAGWEATPVGNIYFAGEHTSSGFQGYMNGAAETGRVAAEQIAANILTNKSKK